MKMKSSLKALLEEFLKNNTIERLLTIAAKEHTVNN